MTAATSILWRVQCRKSRSHSWFNKGLFETRDAAREEASYQRWHGVSKDEATGYGFGNTRVVRYVKAKKGQGK